MNTPPAATTPAELVWRLVHFEVLKGEVDNQESIMLVVGCAGKIYGVTVTGDAPLRPADSINAMHAARAHMMRLIGAPLPEGTRAPEPGETACPSSKNVN